MSSFRRASAALLLLIAAHITPAAHRDVVRAMVAELHAIVDSRDRVTFVVGALWALLRLVVFMPIYAAFHQWTWFAGVGVASIVSMLDMHRGGICVLVPFVLLGGVIGGTLHAQRAWQWIGAMTTGLATTSMRISSGFLDLADLLSVAPLLIIATHLGALARRVMDSRFRSVNSG